MSSNGWIGAVVSGLLVVTPTTGRAVSFLGLGPDPSGSFSTQPMAISADGSTVVGSGSRTGFVWDAVRGMRGPEELPGWTRSGAAPNGVSADGGVVVGNGGSFEGFVWDATRGMRDLGGLPSEPVYSEANAVSADGRVVVGRADSRTTTVAVRWDSTSGLQELGDLAGGAEFSEAFAVSGDGGTIVGRSASDSGLKAFVWDSANGIQALGDLPGARFGSAANAVSADGSVVVGSAYPSGGFEEPFIWDRVRGIRRLVEPSGGAIFHGAALGISADGSVVVGRALMGGGVTRPYIWDAENGLRYLDELLTSLGIDLSDWSLEGAVGVSADGRTIVGHGARFSTGRETWVAVIPEPTVAVLLGFGLVGLGVRRGARSEPRGGCGSSRACLASRS